MANLRLFRQRQLATERAASIVGAIYNPSAKPTRRVETEPERDARIAGVYANGSGELHSTSAPAVYSFPRYGAWSRD